MRILVLIALFWYQGWDMPLLCAEKIITIRLMDRATVAGPNIALGDVAVLNGDDKVEVDRLDRMVVERAAPMGQKVSVAQTAIKMALSREGYSLTAIRLVGADSSLVLTQTQEVTPDQLLGAAQDFILSQTGEDPRNLKIKLLGPLKNLVLPTGTLGIHYRPALVGQYEGVQILTAELTVDGHNIRVVPVRLDAQILHAVVQTTKAINKGDKFTVDNVSLERVPTSQILKGTLQHMDDVLGRRAAFDLNSGIPVRFSEINDPPVIRRGTIVQAFVETGNVEIAVHARAVADGKAGEEILVENTDSHKILKAKVLDENSVLIDQTKP
jgi:flagellar basal body P-ring formation protein FlgA